MKNTSKKRRSIASSRLTRSTRMTSKITARPADTGERHRLQLRMTGHDMVKITYLRQFIGARSAVAVARTAVSEAFAGFPGRAKFAWEAGAPRKELAAELRLAKRGGILNVYANAQWFEQLEELQRRYGGVGRGEAVARAIIDLAGVVREVHEEQGPPE